MEGRGLLGWAGWGAQSWEHPGSRPLLPCRATRGNNAASIPSSRPPGLPGQPGPEAALTWREPGHGEGPPGRAGLPASSSVAAEWPDAAASSSRPPPQASPPPPRLGVRPTRLCHVCLTPMSIFQKFPVGGAERTPRPPPRSQCQTSERAQETKVAFSPPGLPAGLPAPSAPGSPASGGRGPGHASQDRGRTEDGGQRPGHPRARLTGAGTWARPGRRDPCSAAAAVTSGHGHGHGGSRPHVGERAHPPAAG